MQIWPLLTRSLCRASVTQVTVKSLGLLLFCLFVFGLFCPTWEFFTLMDTSAFARHSWSSSNEGFLECHTYCDMGHPFIMVISGDPCNSQLLSSVWQWNVTTCFYYLVLSRLGFEHPTFLSLEKKRGPAFEVQECFVPRMVEIEPVVL